MKFVKDEKTKKVLVNILDMCVDFGGGLLEIMTTVKPGRLVFNPFYKEMCAERERLYLQHLERKKLLTKRYEPSTKKVLYCMTENATCLAALEGMREVTGKPVKWRGRWYVIVFDIPEDKDTIRVFLRRYLKELGFYRYQQSVWITPHDITKYFAIFIASAHLKQWVRMFEVQKIYPNDDQLLKHFNISH